jgi:hypothetical protein
LQEQAVWLTLKAGELALAPHDLHVSAAPVLLEAKYLPAAQSVQTELPATDTFPAEQSTQVQLPAPPAAEDVPAGHAWRGQGTHVQKRVKAQQQRKGNRHHWHNISKTKSGQGRG